jgi:nucleotide-binding universal stress UspA family protein
MCEEEQDRVAWYFTSLGPRGGTVYKRMMVAYDESPEAKRALEHGLELAKLTGAQLRLVTVSEPLPGYVAYVEAAFPGSKQVLAVERENFYQALQMKAKELARESGLETEGVIIEGHEVDSLVESIAQWPADLLVIGRRHHPSPIGRVWGGTLHEIAEKTNCSILAVY